MLLAGKAAYAGIVFLLLTTWISGTRPRLLTSTADAGKEVSEAPHRNDVTTMQLALQDKGHYHGNVDGVLGLRTRASIRAYQKAENLPVTGRFDNQTARKLGIAPEGGKTVHENVGAKPSAGMKWAKGSRRTSKTLRNTKKSVATPESERGGSGETIQAEN